MNWSLTIKTGQCQVQRYMRSLLKMIEAGQIDPSFVVTHRMKLDVTPEGYKLFKSKHEDCIKIVMQP